MVVKIGQLVVAQSLLTRAEAAVQLAAEQRARALRGEAILLGTMVRLQRTGRLSMWAVKRTLSKAATRFDLA